MRTQRTAQRSQGAPSRLISRLAAVLLLALASSACTGDSDSGAKAGDLKLVDEAPKADQSMERVNWGTTANPESLDPALGTGAADEIVTNLCESLIRLDTDGSIRPLLAESVENPDPLTFVYTIRSGVTFWNGDEMTAADVAYSLNRHLDPASLSNFALYFSNVGSVEVTGDRQVTVRMTSPDYVFPNQLATFAGAIVQQSYAESAGKQFGTKAKGVMCTGPFTLESWTPEVVTLTANPAYWNAEAQPKVANLSFRLIADEDTVTSGLISGDLDGASVFGSTGATRLQDAPGDLIFGASSLNTQLITTKRDGPLKDQRVREALSLALPRDGIAKVVYADTVVPAKSIITSLASWSYGQPVFEAYFEDRAPLSTAGDLDEARALIDAADLDSTKIVIAVGPEFQEVSDLVVEAANSIGLDARAEILNATESMELYYDEALRDRYDGFVLPWNTNLPDPLEMLIYFQPDGVYNYSGYDNPEFTELVDEALATADSTKRAELVVDALTILDGDQPWISIVDQPYLTYMSQEIGGAPVSSFTRSWSQWAAHLAGR